MNLDDFSTPTHVTIGCKVRLRSKSWIDKYLNPTVGLFKHPLATSNMYITGAHKRIAGSEQTVLKIGETEPDSVTVLDTDGGQWPVPMWFIESVL